MSVNRDQLYRSFDVVICRRPGLNAPRAGARVRFGRRSRDGGRCCCGREQDNGCVDLDVTTNDLAVRETGLVGEDFLGAGCQLSSLPMAIYAMDRVDERMKIYIGLAELFTLLWGVGWGSGDRRRWSSVRWEDNARSVDLDVAVDDLAIGQAGLVGDFLVGTISFRNVQQPFAVMGGDQEI